MAVTGQRGLSLVELLIALAISLLLMAGVVEIVLGSKQTYQSSLALAELQESGRFALDILSQDLRSAGFAGGCPSGLVNASGLATAPFALEKAGIEGFGSGMSAPAWVPSTRLANTDALLLRYVGEPALTARSITGNQLLLVSAGASAGAHYLLSDLQSCLLMRNAGSTNVLVADRALDHFLVAATRAYPYRYVIYSVRKGEDGTPGLFIADNSGGTASELIGGVAGLSLRYGISEGGEAIASYKAAREMAATDWAKVRAVRVSLLLQSVTRNVDEAPAALVFDGRTLAADADRRLRLVMSSTVVLRNAVRAE